MIVWNVIRALVVIEAICVIAASVQVMRLYFRRYMLSHRLGSADRRKRLRGEKQATEERSPWMGLLPAHVWKLSVGVCLMAISIGGLAVARVDELPAFDGFPLIAALVGMAIVCLGLRDVLNYEHRLIARH